MANERGDRKGGASSSGAPPIAVLVPLLGIIATLTLALFTWVHSDISELRKEQSDQKSLIKDQAFEIKNIQEKITALTKTLKEREADNFESLCRSLHGDYDGNSRCVFKNGRPALVYKPLTE